MPENKNIEIKIKDSEDQGQEHGSSEIPVGLDENHKTAQENNVTGEELHEDKDVVSDNQIRKLEARIEELEKEVEANYDRFVRITADFENYKKRTARDASDLRKFANESILKDMLSVVDNMERAIESGQNQDSEKQTLLEGVEITLKDLLRIFEKYGVKDFKSQGELFNPVFHQAMMQQQTNDSPDNTVISELQKGYTIHDRLLRPAMVVVAKNVSDNQNDETDESN